MPVAQLELKPAAAEIYRSPSQGEGRFLRPSLRQNPPGFDLAHREMPDRARAQVLLPGPQPQASQGHRLGGPEVDGSAVLAGPHLRIPAVPEFPQWLLPDPRWCGLRRWPARAIGTGDRGR